MGRSSREPGYLEGTFPIPTAQLRFPVPSKAERRRRRPPDKRSHANEMSRILVVNVHNQGESQSVRQSESGRAISHADWLLRSQ